MKHFLISYRLSTGPESRWHEEIERFIAALQSDPELGGRISYRCFKSAVGPEYYHLAKPVDENAARLLGERDFFSRYTDLMDVASAGSVTVLPLESIAQTKRRA